MICIKRTHTSQDKNSSPIVISASFSLENEEKRIPVSCSLIIGNTYRWIVHTGGLSQN